MATVDITLLGGTTALLLLAVFTIVNIAVLVLRRDRVEHAHFRAPSWTPYVGIVLCGFLATPLSGSAALQQFVVAGILLAVGAVLWVVNYLVVGKSGRGSRASSPRAERAHVTGLSCVRRSHGPSAH